MIQCFSLLLYFKGASVVAPDSEDPIAPFVQSSTEHWRGDRLRRCDLEEGGECGKRGRWLFGLMHRRYFKGNGPPLRTERWGARTAESKDVAESRSRSIGVDGYLVFILRSSSRVISRTGSAAACRCPVPFSARAAGSNLACPHLLQKFPPSERW